MVALSESEAATERSTQLAAPPPVQYRARASDRSTVYHVQRQASSSFKPHQLRCQVSDGPQTDGIDTFVRRCTMRNARNKRAVRSVNTSEPHVFLLWLACCWRVLGPANLPTHACPLSLSHTLTHSYYGAAIYDIYCHCIEFSDVARSDNEVARAR